MMGPNMNQVGRYVTLKCSKSTLNTREVKLKCFVEENETRQKSYFMENFLQFFGKK